MRIVFLAVDDEFAGSMQRYVYEQLGASVVGSVISTCSVYKKSRFGAMIFVLRRSGLRYGLEMFKMKVVRKMMPSEEKTGPSQLAMKYGVETFYTSNINSDSSVNRLMSWAPDIIISTNFSHYLGERVRRIARIGTWNLHKSYLPHYRGMAPSFYALLQGERCVGVTLHKISKQIDAGDIIRQAQVPLEPGDSVYSLNRRTSDVGGRMLAEVMHEADRGEVVALPQPAGDWPNYTYPTRAQVRAFLRKGFRF